MRQRPDKVDYKFASWGNSREGRMSAREIDPRHTMVCWKRKIEELPDKHCRDPLVCSDELVKGKV